MTTTDAPTFLLVGVCERKVGEGKILRWIMNALKLIVMLVVKECNESFCITVDLLELIVSYIAGF